MKTEIIEAGKPKEIDWSKPMLVKAEDGTFVLTDGKSDDDTFNGTLLFERITNFQIGWYSDGWCKHKFTPITEPLTIKFYPNE